MLNRMIQINLLYNNWLSLFILITFLLLAYYVAKYIYEKNMPKQPTQQLTQLNRELIKIDGDLKILHEEIEKLK